MSFDQLVSGAKTAGSAVLGPKGAGALTQLGPGGTAIVLGQAGAQVVGGAIERATARRNARLMRQRAAVEAAQARREGAAVIARGRAARGAAGIEIAGGSALDVTLATAEAMEMRALRTAYPFLAEAAAMESEGDLALWTGLIGGATSILGTGARARLAKIGPSGTPPISPTKPKKKKRPLGSPRGGPLPPPSTRTT